MHLLIRGGKQIVAHANREKPFENHWLQIIGWYRWKESKHGNSMMELLETLLRGWLN